MLALGTLGVVRGICATIDTIALTVIAAAITKKSFKGRKEFSAFSSIPSSLKPHQMLHTTDLAVEKSPHIDSSCGGSESDHVDLRACSQPALIKLKNERDPEKLFEIFRENASNRLVVENRFAFQDTIGRLSGARRFDLVEKLLENQKSLPQGRREGFLIRIIMLYGKAGMINHALQTFYEMHLFGCKRTVKSFNATLKVLTTSRRYEDLERLLHEVQRLDISLDTQSYNLIINSLCVMGQLEPAYLMMVEMEKSGLEPDVVTYTTLMSAFYKHNQRVIGDGLWNLMILRGCSPNLATYNVRIQFLVNKYCVRHANRLMKKMPLCGIEPDELTYNLIIKGFGLIGDIEMAKSIFYSMQGNKCKPNAKIYQTIIHYLCTQGDFNLAFRLCKDSMMKNWFPNANTICQLLEGLKFLSMENNVKELMNLVSKRVPPYASQKLSDSHRYHCESICE